MSAVEFYRERVRCGRTWHGLCNIDDTVSRHLEDARPYYELGSRPVDEIDRLKSNIAGRRFYRQCSSGPPTARRVGSLIQCIEETYAQIWKRLHQPFVLPTTSKDWRRGFVFPILNSVARYPVVFTRNTDLYSG